MVRLHYVLVGTLLAGLAGCAASGGKSGTAVMGKPATGPDRVEEEDLFNADILPQTHMAAGRLHESKQQFDRAAEQYRLALGIKPDFAEGWNRLGVVLDQMGRFKAADQAFGRAIELAPRWAHLHNNLGFSFVMQGRWQEAEAAFRKAVELKPDFARAHVNLAMTLAQQDRYEEAYREFRMSLTRADAFYNLGLMYQSKRMLQEAAGAFKAALKQDPDMVAAIKRLQELPEDAVSSAEAMSFAGARANPAPAAVAEVAPEPASPTEQPVEPRIEMLTGDVGRAEGSADDATSAKPPVAIPEAETAPAVPQAPAPIMAEDPAPTTEEAFDTSRDDPFARFMVDWQPRPIVVKTRKESKPSEPVKSAGSAGGTEEGGRKTAAPEASPPTASGIEESSPKPRDVQGPEPQAADSSTAPSRSKASDAPAAGDADETALGQTSPCWALFTLDGAPIDALAVAPGTSRAPLPLALND